MLRLFAVLFMSLALTVSAQAQEAAGSSDRSATGGAQTLEDILARQKGLKLDDSFRSDVTGNPEQAPSISEQLGTRGGASDPDLWRAYRYDSADITTQARGPAATTLIQDGGMSWLQFRQGPLATYGAYLLGGTIALLALFYMIRGRIRIDGKQTGKRIERFKAVERFGHWLLAGSFVILGITGLISLFGRKVLIPAFGKEAFADLALASKWIHDNVAWAFMLGLVMVFVMWVVHNIPHKTDINWLLKGGGIFTKGHPPAKKFNAGQKLIFWAVIVFGASISASGLSLLFPFQLPMFASTFGHLNDLGLPQMVGLGPLPTDLAPHEEMQLSQLWHAIMAFLLMAVIIAHIYIGTVGMEGAYDAMGKGHVEEQWAREHHSLWVEEIEAKQAKAGKA